MAKGASTGIEVGIETTTGHGAGRERETFTPGKKSKHLGLGQTGNPQSQKQPATSPLYRLLKRVTHPFSPKSKLTLSPETNFQTPNNRTVHIDDHGLTHISKPDGSISTPVMLAHSLGMPLPKFDPDNEILTAPQSSSAPAAPPKLDGPVTLASIHAVNETLLRDFCGKVKRELKIRDDYINEMSAKLNAMLQLLYGLITRLAEYENSFEQVENAVGTYESRAQRREWMM